MLRNKYISPINGIRFIPAGETIAPRYNTYTMDNAWFEELILNWQDQTSYDQKIQQNDRLSLQILTSFNTDPFVGGEAFPITMVLYTCTGDTVKSFSFVVHPEWPLFDGMMVQNYVNNTFWADVPEGEYYLYGTIGYDTKNTGAPDVFDNIISERIFVSDRWEETILHEYGNSYNKDNVCYTQSRQRFSFRVEGAVLNYAALVERVSFVDQGEITTPLFAKAYRGWRVFYGGNGSPIPTYAIDMANNIWTLNSVRVEGKGYVPADGAAFTQEEIEVFPKYAANIEVRETQNPYLHTKGAIVLIQPVPAYPFVINWVYVGYVSDYQFTYEIPTMFFNDTDLNSYIDTLNDEAINQGMEGAFSFTLGQIIYSLGDNENFDDGIANYRTTAVNVLNQIAAPGNIDINFGLFSLSGTSFYSIFDNEGTLLAYGNANTGGISAIASYTAIAAGIYTIYLWHDDNLSGLAMNGANILSSEGDPPINLRLFNINGSTQITNFGIATTLSRCRSTLQTLMLINNSNLDVVGGYYINPGNILGWPLLKTITLTNNSLLSSAVDDLFIQINNAATDGVFIPSAGTVRTNGQTPSAPPSAGSAGARLNLQLTYGWTIITD